MSFSETKRGQINATSLALAVLLFLFCGSSAHCENRQLFPERPQVETQQEAKGSVENQDSSKNQTPFWTLTQNEYPSTESEHGGDEGTEYWPTFLGLKLKITDSLLALFTCVLALLTGHLAGSTKKLWVSTETLAYAAVEQCKDMKDSIAAAQTSANAAKRSADAAIAVQLPKVFLSNVSLFGVGIPTNDLKVAKVRASVINYGNTPAFITREAFELIIAPSLPITPVYDRAFDAIDGTVIQPNKSHPLTEAVSRQVLSDQDIADIQFGSLQMWVYGFVMYTDFLGEPHGTGFCRVFHIFDGKLKGQPPRFLSHEQEGYTYNF